MKKRFTIFCIALIVGLTAGVFLARAQNVPYPVAELGNCKSKAECKAYCDKIENVEACVTTGLKLGLITQKEAKEARKFAKIGGKGPGGCTSKKQCDSYCTNMSHLEECIAFGAEHGLMSPAELREAQGVAKALRAGAKPPGGCATKSQCDSYCSNSAHIEECVAFSKAAGLISKKELKEMEKIMPLMKSGQMPGGCMSKKACDKYCADEKHINECMDFAVKAGFMSKEEAEMVKKTGGKGPGGCKSKKSCDKFCNKPENEKTCFEFGMKYGMIPKKELEKMKKGMAEMKKMLGEAPPEVFACLQGVLGAGTVASIQAGKMVFVSRSAGDSMSKCWDKYKPPEPEKGPPPQNGQQQPPPLPKKDFQKPPPTNGQTSSPPLPEKNFQKPPPTTSQKPQPSLPKKDFQKPPPTEKKSTSNEKKE